MWYRIPWLTPAWSFRRRIVLSASSLWSSLWPGSLAGSLSLERLRP
ncbi:hypothetical protein [Marinobacter sp. C2H3]